MRRRCQLPDPVAGSAPQPCGVAHLVAAVERLHPLDELGNVVQAPQVGVDPAHGGEGRGALAVQGTDGQVATFGRQGDLLAQPGHPEFAFEKLVHSVERAARPASVQHQTVAGRAQEPLFVPHGRGVDPGRGGKLGVTDEDRRGVRRQGGLGDGPERPAGDLLEVCRQFLGGKALGRLRGLCDDDRDGRLACSSDDNGMKRGRARRDCCRCEDPPRCSFHGQFPRTGLHCVPEMSVSAAFPITPPGRRTCRF